MDMIRKFMAGIITVCFLLISSVNLIAQKDGKADFSAAVDQINCETVKFIHREAGRNSIADKMECFTFESIYKSIPDDEASSTGRLSKDLNNFKAKYNPKEDLGKQLDAVVAYAYSKITKKKRKASVEDYKNKLEECKKEALESFNQSTAEAPPVADKKKDEPKKEVATEPAKANKDSAKAKPEPAKAENKEILPDNSNDKSAPNWIAWAGAGLGLISLLLSIFALMRLKKYMEEAESRNEEPSPELTRPTTPLVRESPDNYRLLEIKFNDEIRSLKSYYDTKIAELNAALTAHKEETKEETVPEMEFSISKTEEPIMLSEESNTSAEEAEEHHTEIKEEVKKEISKPEVIPSIGSLFESLEPEQLSPAKNFEMALDAEMLPTYRFASLPGEGLNFDESNFTDVASPESVIEIESYADVPGRAFFSLLNYPEVVQKALADPSTFIDPYCRYEISPEGKSRIILLEEGILQKEDGHWVISSKAHVRFE